MHVPATEKNASLQQQAEGVQRTIRKCVYILEWTILCFEYAPMHFTLTIVSPLTQNDGSVSCASEFASLCGKTHFLMRN